MNTKKNKRARKPELLVVEDRSIINDAVESGELTPEEAEKMFGELARNGRMMNTEDGEKYLKIFGMPQFFIGASEAAVIAGESPFKSPLFLQHEKLGMVVKSITPSVAWRFAYGHIFERPVAETGIRMLRAKGELDARYVECINGYINTRWPHVLIHPDGFVLDRKSGKLLYLAEVKTAAEESPHWNNDLSRNKVPLDYQDQCLVEMEVLSAAMDIDKCYVLASNKTGDEDGFVQLVVERDSEKAIKLLDAMEKFYEDTVSGLMYEDSELLPEEAAVLFKAVDKSMGYVELPKKHEKTLKLLSDLQDEHDALKEEISEVEKDLRENEKQQRVLKSRLYSGIGRAPGGTMQIGSDVYHVDVIRSCSFDEEVRRMIADEFPEAWEKIKEFKPLIRTKITKVAATAEASGSFGSM